MTAYRGGQSMGVLIGIDPHKKSVNAAAATETSRESSPATRDAAERFFTPDFVEHIPAPRQGQGLEGMRRWLEEVYFPAFPDVRWSAEEQVAEADKVLTRFVWRGTHRGEFAGIAPTEERVEVWGMVLDRIADGKVVESRILHDTVSMLQQMGVMGPPEQSE
jgi:predicted ester cyclase